ncbi:MAG: tetratricopeptide repeat protein [Bacteroidia bacterium]
MLRRKSKRIQHRRLFRYEAIITFCCFIFGGISYVSAQSDYSAQRKKYFKAENLFSNGDVLRAATLWEELLYDTQFTEKNAVYYRLAKCYHAQGKFPQAHYYHKKCVEANPSNENFLFDLAESWERQYQYDSALGIYLKLIQLNPRYIRRHEKALMAARKSRNTAKAIEIGDAWIESFGRNEYISRQLFKLHLENKDTISALREIQLLSERLPHRDDISQWLLEIKEITSEKKVEMPNGFEQIISVYDDLMLGKWTSAYQNSDGALEHKPENITLHKMRLYAAFMEKDLEHFNEAWEHSTMLFPFLDELTELNVAVTPFLMNSNKSSKHFLVLNESDWIGLIKAEGLRFTGDNTKSKALFNRLLVDPNISKPFIKKRINPNPTVK